MTHQQLEAVERSLAGLSALDKLELIGRLVHELRSAAMSEPFGSARDVKTLTEQEFKQQLLKSGLMMSLPTPSDPSDRPGFDPVVLEGEPLSESIIRERR